MRWNDTTKAVTAVALLCATITISFAQTPSEDKLVMAFQKILPSMQVDEVNETPIPGLVEVVSGSDVFYSSIDGAHVLRGEMLDITQTPPINLTEEKNKALRIQAINAVSEDTMIVFPANGEQKGQITVFSDVDCPYCQQLHRELPVLTRNGIQVRYIAFPRTGYGTPSYEKSIAVWCADNPHQAITDAKNGYAISRGEHCTDATVNRHMELVKELEFNVTPMIVLDSGTVISGYVPADRLMQAVFEDGKNYQSIN